MKIYSYLGCLTLVLSSCSMKDAKESVQDSVSVAVSNETAQPGRSTCTKVQSVQEPVLSEVSQLESDTLQADSLKDISSVIECYDWNNTFKATTLVEDEEGDQFKLHIDFIFHEMEGNNYTGTLHMYLSDSRDDAFQGKVHAVAEGNHLTVYFSEDIEGMADMFRPGDRLVRFELSYGEYVASWFAPMHDYVDEYTVLTLGE